MYNEALAEHTTALELAKQQGQSIAIQDNLQVRNLLHSVTNSTNLFSVCPFATHHFTALPVAPY